MSENLKNTILTAIDDLKGVDAKAFLVDNIVGYTDWIVIVTGTSTRHTKTLAHKVEEKVRIDLNIKAIGTEGESEGEWVLIDFGDVVVHVLTAEMRDYYQLEKLCV
jgi:ribosome-associated protein